MSAAASKSTLRTQVASTLKALSPAQLVAQSVVHLISCASDAEQMATLSAKRTRAEHDATVAALRAELLERTGQSSLPQVFVNGESVGGLYSGSPGLVELERPATLKEALRPKCVPARIKSVRRRHPHF